MVQSRRLPGWQLDGTSTMPLYRQIYERIAARIRDGQLPPGSRVPSTRSLAAQLSIARGTVDTAYQMLGSEGYLVTRGAAGTRIDPTLDPALLRPAISRRPATGVAAPDTRDTPVRESEMLRPGLPALDAFPYRTWARLLARQVRAMVPADLDNQDPLGHERLRIQIVRYLAVARGVSCIPAQVIITSGYLGALGLIARCLAGAKEAIWVEDPTYYFGRDALRSAGLRPVGVPVDRDGFDLDYALSNAEAARLAVLTPTHQFPLGVSMSLPRRIALLRWAADTKAWILEDDYDSEFRYKGKPLPALKSLDRHDRVLFVGTFSKILAPGLRVGYLVSPLPLVGLFAEAARLVLPPPAPLIQATIAAFIEHGYLARHIRRMRQLYAERRAALVDALMQHVRPTLGIDMERHGMHLLARLSRGTDDVALVRRVAREGIVVRPLSACGVARPYEPGLVIGFANVDARKAPDVARQFARAMTSRPLRKPSSRVSP
jgi:GntR family transcriptional regulator / MocR family aminotransferase